MTAGPPNRQVNLSPLARNFAAVVQTMAFGWAIRAFYLVLVARTLGPEQYGTFVYGVAFYVSIGVLTNFGQGLLFASRMSTRPRTQPTLVAHSLTLTLLMLVVTVAGALAFAWWFYRGTSLHWVVVGFLGALVGRTLVGWVRDCAVAMEDARWVPGYELGFRLLELVVGVGLVILDLDLLAFVINHSAIWLIEAAFAIWLMRRRWGLRLRLGRDRRMLAATGRASMIFLLNIAGLHLLGQAGVLTLQQIQPDLEIVGQFGVAMQVMMTLTMLPAALAATVAPAIGRTRRHQGSGELTALARAVRLLLVFGGIAAVLLTAYGPPLVTLVFGEQYVPAAQVIAILSWALGPYSVALFACNALNVLDGRGQAAAIAVTMTVIHVAALVLLAPGGALVAAASSFVAASVAGCIGAVVVIGRRIGVPGHMWWAAPTILVAAAGGLLQLLPVALTIAAPAVVAVLVVIAFGVRAVSLDDLKFVRDRFGARQARGPTLS